VGGAQRRPGGEGKAIQHRHRPDLTWISCCWGEG